MSNKHIIIVGGGIIGASCAYFLSQQDGYTITLLEQTDIACAASGKAGGFLALDWNDDHPGMKALSRASYKLHEELAKQLDGEKAYGYRKMQTYSVVFDTSLSKKRRKTTASASSNVTWINRDYVRSAEKIGDTTTTAQVMPPQMTKKLIEEAKKSGRVEVRVRTGVKQLLFENDLVVGVEIEGTGENLHGDKVIICMGPWSGLLPLPNQERIPIRASHVHSIVLKPKDVIPGDALFTTIIEDDSTAEPETYPRPDGTVYLCGASDNEPLTKNASEVHVADTAIETLQRQATIISSQLAKMPLIQGQACYLPISEKTQMPLIGPHPRFQQLILATGHSFWGILNAPITGKAISELLTKGKIECLDEKVMEYFRPTI
ncbi:FAD dependent oxidoreductase [Mycotypha africana]|uniref:FAD dependent oxidoreductase n=1 Tax=Mycotypha africana TaxID=64632 RepID=UPI0022FFE438|nr:FAD dependent oxidoreductase [Mycotypha africana]KAI8967309.1 FAD dependent oxidoreductase [Mycotypha africana]